MVRASPCGYGNSATNGLSPDFPGAVVSPSEPVAGPSRSSPRTKIHRTFASPASPIGPSPDIVGVMPSPKRSWIPAASGDLLLILAFAAIGRDAHSRGDIITGVFLTAWPFLVGAATGWLAGRAWRKPFALWPSGIVIWAGALLVGMLLRALTGQVVVLPFFIVAFAALAALLLGFRLVVGIAVRLYARGRRPA